MYKKKAVVLVFILFLWPIFFALDGIALSNINTVDISLLRIRSKKELAVLTISIIAYNNGILPAWISGASGKIYINEDFFGVFELKGFYIPGKSKDEILVFVQLFRNITFTDTLKAIKVTIVGELFIGLNIIPLEVTYIYSPNGYLKTIHIIDVFYYNGGFLAVLNVFSMLKGKNIALDFEAKYFYNESVCVVLRNEKRIFLKDSLLTFNTSVEIENYDLFGIFLGDYIFKDYEPTIELRLNLTDTITNSSIQVHFNTTGRISFEGDVELKLNEAEVNETMIVLNVSIIFRNSYSLEINLTKLEVNFYCKDQLLAAIQTENVTLPSRSITNISLLIFIFKENIDLILSEQRIYTKDSFIRIQIVDIKIKIPVSLYLELDLL